MASKIFTEMMQEARERRAKAQPVAAPLTVPGKWWFLDHDPVNVDLPRNFRSNRSHGPKDMLQETAEAINNNLHWDETTEGSEFWQWVYNRLHYYAQNRP